MKNWLEAWFGPKPEPPAPPVDHGRADIFKPGDRILCVYGNAGMGLTEGKLYFVPFLPSDKVVPVYNDFGSLALCSANRFIPAP